MMGDGVIDIPRIRGWVEAQGFAGYSEVEIFSTGNWWRRDHDEVLDTCIAAAPQRRLRHRRAAGDVQPTAWTARTVLVGRAARRGAAPNSTSPDSWPPSSITTLP